MFGLLAGALSPVAHALFSTLLGDRQKTREAFLIASFASFAIGLPMLAGLAIVVDDALHLFLDPKWADAGFVIQAFCAMGVLACFGVVQGALIKGQGHTNWWFYYQMAQQLMTVVVILVTFRMGLPTMMVALAVKTLVLWPISAVMTTRLLDVKIHKYLLELSGPVIATIAMVVAVLGLPHFFPEMSATVKLALQILTGIITYGIALLSVSGERINRMRTILRTKGRPTP